MSADGYIAFPVAPDLIVELDDGPPPVPPEAPLPVVPEPLPDELPPLPPEF